MHTRTNSAIGIFGAALLAGSLNIAAANASTITVMIGDDDGFGGTQGATSSAGDAYSNAAAAVLGTIAPGTIVDEAGLDVNTTSPWAPYIFEFNFVYDLTAEIAVNSAIVGIQHGSVGRRTTGIPSGSGPGFGFAEVSGSTGGPTTSLGDFYTLDTSPTGSASEESVKISTFDVTSLLVAGTSGTLTLSIDGMNISPNPVDLFAMDFAKLTIETTTIPVPASLPLLFGGLAGLVLMRRRRSPH